MMLIDVDSFDIPKVLFIAKVLVEISIFSRYLTKTINVRTINK